MNQTANEDKKWDKNNSDRQKKLSYSKLEYRLVLWMLSSLTVLVILLILFPVVMFGCFGADLDKYSNLIDYSKWVLTALLAAFGAWIGAGAAYFFGRENLRLSSESTEKALMIQRGDRRDNATIRDIKPTPLDPDFTFSIDSKFIDVWKKLETYVNYWFVPVIKNDELKDIIHTETFRRYYWKIYQNDRKGVHTVNNVIEFIESPEFVKKKRRLHKFFVKVSMDDSVNEIFSIMNERDADVGVVCTNDNKPTHCFSRRDLRSFEYGRN